LVDVCFFFVWCSQLGGWQTGVAQALLQRLVGGASVGESVGSARAHEQLLPVGINLESRIAPSVGARLRALGHTVVMRGADYAGNQQKKQNKKKGQYQLFSQRRCCANDCSSIRRIAGSCVRLAEAGFSRCGVQNRWNLENEKSDVMVRNLSVAKCHKSSFPIRLEGTLISLVLILLQTQVLAFYYGLVLGFLSVGSSEATSRASFLRLRSAYLA
jgi:hypothetical protein